MELTTLARNAVIALAYALSLLAVCWLTLDAAFPDPVGVASCPKVEYREVTKRGRIVRDTVTAIPEECR